MVRLWNSTKGFLIYYKRLAEELNVVSSVKRWARNSLEECDFRDELSKAEQTPLFEVHLDLVTIFVYALSRHSYALKEIEHHFSKNVMLLNFCLDYDSIGHKHHNVIIFFYVGV